MEPLQWLAHAVVRFPEQAGEQRGDYFDRLEVKMRRELKGKALKAVSIGRQLYAINALPRRQPRPKKTLTNSH